MFYTRLFRFGFRFGYSNLNDVFFQVVHDLEQLNNSFKKSLLYLIHDLEPNNNLKKKKEEKEKKDNGKKKIKLQTKRRRKTKKGKGKPEIFKNG